MTLKTIRSRKLRLALGATALTLMAGTASADIQHLDDVIISFSLCVGNDCVNGESFGFDTVRLKENNTRLHFDDTSTSASFPRNDWRFTANDSSNGGGSYMAIEDSTAGRQPFRVDAGARANSVRVNSAGDVGFGTGTPVVNLHVVDGNTPTLRLEQDGSAGFAAQTFDVAANEANFFVRDATNGSTLPFRIKPGAPSNAIYVAASGVGLGDDTPDEDLDIKGGANDTIAIELENDTTWRIRNQGAAGATNGWLEFRNADAATTIPMRIAANANNNLLLVGAADSSTADADRVSITGELFINGVDNSNPDYVFEPDYALESIEEHAAFMWTNKHLPAVGGGVNDQNGKAVINVANRSQGVLEELEKAHIYIEQLNTQLKLQGEQIDTLKQLIAVQ